MAKIQRLTKRVGTRTYVNTDVIPREECNGEYGFTFCKYVKTCPNIVTRTCPVLKLLDKLADYEDKEEANNG